MVKKIILDCDPGHDDALALMLAYGNPEIELMAVTTVAGNQTLKKVTNNALSLATLIGMKNVPIAAGCDRPLVNEIKVAADVHGESGIDGTELPAPEVQLEDINAVDLIIDTIMNNPANTITLVPTGALTNIATAVRREPRIVERVKEVVLMGGAYKDSNASAVAEFNIIVDPEAAHIVFNAGWKLTMVGLDVTHKALATEDVIEELENINTVTSIKVKELMLAFRGMYKENQNFDFPPVHDPVTIAYLIDPTVMDVVNAPIDIELNGKLTRGMTVVDFSHVLKEEVPTNVGVSLDKQKFWNLIYDALRVIG
ncbi:ribonucleoside hydrolase [Companilactobacillus sp. RD055328]|uniref:uridine-preferring nucleoside hydrolase UriH n=1 Tax=Companilactobacillus sp. RD055328 TaxID=2916634 RepID=UPI001FC80246|nr:nucleoside hydrolase [Companilactobacillus sp. RD055328]GKQ42380.1 ribonucleoside hydrolase [Companilactobacillus sp. RD055328]